MLTKIISGMQCGADIAGVKAAKLFGIETGGYMPRGYKTIYGGKPEYAKLYGAIPMETTDYLERTHKNIEVSDGTVRLAKHYDSPGERATLKGIVKFAKPHFDVKFDSFGKANKSVHLFGDWITSNNIQVLNVAGNSTRTWIYAEQAALEYMCQTLKYLGFHYTHLKGQKQNDVAI